MHPQISAAYAGIYGHFMEDVGMQLWSKRFQYHLCWGWKGHSSYGEEYACHCFTRSVRAWLVPTLQKASSKSTERPFKRLVHRDLNPNVDEMMGVFQPNILNCRWVCVIIWYISALIYLGSSFCSLFGHHCSSSPFLLHSGGSLCH